MEMSRSSSLRMSSAIFALSAVAGGLVCAVPSRAFAVPTVELRPTPQNMTVKAGQSGIIDFSLKNTGSEVFDVRTIAPRLDYGAGDEAFKVVSPQIVNAGNCIGRLAVNSLCQFQLSFQTTGPARPGDGTWEVFGTITVQESDPLTRYTFEERALVKVVAVPEASTMALVSFGLLGVAMLARRRTHQLTSTAVL